MKNNHEEVLLLVKLLSLRALSTLIFSSTLRALIFLRALRALIFLRALHALNFLLDFFKCSQFSTCLHFFIKCGTTNNEPQQAGTSKNEVE